MKRYGKFVFEVEKKIYFENYANPPIPEGYKHICGKWYDGFVIERCSDGSQFVWVPVEYLDSNGTLDGVAFTEKFGRRNYQDDEFSEEEFNEPLIDELALQLESVKKYGGFYTSRYNISISYPNKPESLKGRSPLREINFYEAKRLASSMEDSEAVKSHLTFGAEYDSILEWFIESNARTYSEIVKNSTGWGNYAKYSISCTGRGKHVSIDNYPRGICPTGSSEDWSTNNICDFAGNVSEWTQEQYCCDMYRVIRGGYYGFGAMGMGVIDYPVSYREHQFPHFRFNCTGFRATLYIK